MDFWLPIFFVGAMGLAMLIYVVLDGYDLGIGLLLPMADDEQKDLMIASIGPFWDANETWLVLGIGVLLIAFPAAHGVILTSLYLPVGVMLVGLILRGVAFDFRVKAVPKQKDLWNTLFFVGSLLATLAQGWMLGSYITGLDGSLINTLFSLLIALTLPSLYVMLGCAWLMIKAEGPLLALARDWAKAAIVPMGVTLLLISIATPMVSTRIADKWFTLPQFLYLLPIPLVTGLAYAFILKKVLRANTSPKDTDYSVFAGLVIICLMAALGLSYSLFPDIVIGQMTLWEAASANESLLFIFWGVAITLPAIIGYTVFVYKVFGGKAGKMSYGLD